MVFTLLFFFLAIVVDAFVVVKEGMLKSQTDNNVVVDVYDVMASIVVYARHRWPKRDHIAHFLSVEEDDVEHVDILVKFMSQTKSSPDRIWTERKLASVLKQEYPGVETWLPDFL